MSKPTSGEQYLLSFGDYRAAIAGVGASLRQLKFRGRDLVVPFNENEVRPAYRGVTLAPWPNRVVDGAYNFAGVNHQLSLTEPSRGHALHGLLSWQEYQAEEVAEDYVVLSAVVPAQAGYPFTVKVTTKYQLSDAGLEQTVAATNLGDVAAPFGTGPHPYLVAGPGKVDDWVFQLPAEEVLEVTEDRLIPTQVAPVTADATRFDFREARLIAAAEIDHAYTGLSFRDGVAEATVLTTNGVGVRMSWNEGCPWVQVHTADLPDPLTTRAGLAVEPMTCPPDAFNSGQDLIVLEPGESTSVAWKITAVG